MSDFLGVGVTIYAPAGSGVSDTETRIPFVEGFLTAFAAMALARHPLDAQGEANTVDGAIQAYMLVLASERIVADVNAFREAQARAAAAVTPFAGPG